MGKSILELDTKELSALSAGYVLAAATGETDKVPVSSVMDVSKLEYDSSNNISAYNGSAFAGGSGGGIICPAGNVKYISTVSALPETPDANTMYFIVSE